MLFFFALIIVLILFLIWLPIAESDNYRFKKVLQVSNVLLTLSIFILMSFSLNLHTGYTGMVNFGVIFFVINRCNFCGILTAPEDLHGYEWNILLATLFGVILAGLIGWESCISYRKTQDGLFCNRHNISGGNYASSTGRRATAASWLYWSRHRNCRLSSAIGEFLVLRV